MVKYCVLDETKICNDCGECNVCDLDPNKICDNCMKCVTTGAAYNAIEIDEIIDDGSGSEAYEQLRRDLAEKDDDKPFACFMPKQYTPKGKTER
ncbi:MAG: hypothetical protein IJJ45_07780 [Clostridia bacterium]|nr:hypothetical protein [Clostridia bacterium]